MVLDINLFRSPESLEIISKSQVGRFNSIEDITDIVTHDAMVRKLIMKKICMLN